MSNLEGEQPKGIAADSQTSQTTGLDRFRHLELDRFKNGTAASADVSGKTDPGDQEIQLALYQEPKMAVRRKSAKQPDPELDTARAEEIFAAWSKLHARGKAVELPGKFSAGSGLEVTNNGDGTCTAKGHFPEQDEKNVITINGKVVKTEKGLLYSFDHGRSISQNSDGSIVSFSPEYDSTIFDSKTHTDSRTTYTFPSGLVIDENAITLPSGTRMPLKRMSKTVNGDGSTEYSFEVGGDKITVDTTGKVTYKDSLGKLTTWNADGTGFARDSYDATIKDKFEKAGDSRSYRSPDGSFRLLVEKDEHGKDRYIVTSGNKIWTVDDKFNLRLGLNPNAPIVPMTRSVLLLDGGSLEMNYADGTGINTDKFNINRKSDGKSAHIHVTVRKPDGTGRQEIWFSLNPKDQTVYFEETSSSYHPSAAASLPEKLAF